MTIPTWVTYIVAAWVITFGLYRLSRFWRAMVAKRTGRAAPRGLWGKASARDGLFGFLFIALGCYLLAMALGYAQSFQAMFSEPEQTIEAVPQPSDTTSIEVGAP